MRTEINKNKRCNMTTEVRKKAKKKTVVTKKSLPSFMKKRIIYHKISKFWHPQQESNL